MSVERRTVIVTDSGADITNEEAEKRGIKIIPIRVTAGELDITDEGVDGLMERMEETIQPNFFKTHAPSIGEFKAVFENTLPEKIHSVHIGSGLSSTVQSATLAAIMVNQEQNLDGNGVEVFDSHSVSAATSFLIDAIAKGATTEDLRDLRRRTVLHAFLPTTRYLKEGGRYLDAIFGKWVLRIGDNKIEKQFPPKRKKEDAIKNLIQKTREAGPIAKAAVIYSREEDAERLGNEVSVFFDGEISKVRIGPVMLVHAGPGAMGIATVSPKEENS